MFEDLRAAVSAHGDEKKVEYLELIYDLIFVYIIGRNNSLLHHVESGFVSPGLFLVYVLCTLAIIQIWNFSTYYINMFGRNGVRDHVFLFINMYLLYYIGEGIRVHWAGFELQFSAAWALILINIGVQYLIELRNHRDEPDICRIIKRMAGILFGEAALVLLIIPTYRLGTPVFILAAILFGIAATFAVGRGSRTELLDFNHLSERAMLYVVFTFGEMIIITAAYFEGPLSLSSVYFSLMVFLIVVALFLSYELLYNRIIDREMKTTGLVYMLIHIFLIFAMNNLTTALEFMRNEQISLWPKTLFLVASFVLFYLCLIAMLRYAKRSMGLCWRFLLPILVLTALFAAAMLLLRGHMYLNIALSVLYVYAMFARIYIYSRFTEGDLDRHSNNIIYKNLVRCGCRDAEPEPEK
ncbi:MAG: low temperature requirement protein A [Oscillospiraceae bacterium]|nr:low temperature requirement protein A [Oscillospiraceae bacterium]